LDLREHKFPLAYKYGVFDVANNGFIRFEDGCHRLLKDNLSRGKHTLVNDGFARLPLKPWPGAGVAVSVFSLRSEQSFGVGEFLDLIPLAKWGNKPA
jgi:4-alpha-glucanotransferase